MAASTFSPGHVLAKRYQISKLIGVGGTAEVYLAEDLSLHRTIVVKVLLPELAAHNDVRNEFRDHIVRGATLSHPSIAKIFDGGQDSGAYFMVTEYLSGGSLADIIGGGQVLAMPDAARIGRDIASALDYLAREGFVLGTLTPAKLLFDQEGNIRIADVALAGLADNYRQDFTLNQVRYLSPEQAQGLAPTEKSDVYALALIIFEALTGEHAFPGNSAEQVLRDRISSPIPARAELGTLDMVLAQATVPDGDMRIDAAQLEQRLSGIVETIPSYTEIPADASGDSYDWGFEDEFVEPSASEPTPAPFKVRELPDRVSPIGFNPDAVQISGGRRARDVVNSRDFQELPEGSSPIMKPRQMSRRPVVDSDLASASRPRGGRRGMALAGIVIVVLLIAGGGLFVAGIFSPSSTKVPSLVGKSMTQANALASKAGVVLSVTGHSHSSNVPVNDIISQRPSAGSSGKSVNVVVSDGPLMTTLPTGITGADCASATAKLAKVGITATCPTTQHVSSETVPAGRVAEVLFNSNVNPTSVPAGSSVVLALSSGKSTGTTSTTTTTLAAGPKVPNFVGLTPAQVNALSFSSGYYYRTVGVHAGNKGWTTVLSQSPAAGSSLKAHGLVTLHVN
jgi:eukaryotic-like serine/threonine-protein kinase